SNKHGVWLVFRITIEHSADSSTLTVNDDACSIHAPRKLAQRPVQKFVNVFTDIVIIPVGLNSPADPKPFLYTFLGGIERESHSTDGSMLLRPIYQCAVANLLGCMRGVRIGGELVDLRHTTHGYRPSDPSLVRSDCDVGCSALDCRNGGHCSVAWRGVGGKVACDCSRTSYAGPHCTVDEGITLASNAHFTFDLGRSSHRSCNSHFAPTSPSTTHQTLATVLFNDERLFEVILNRNGSVNVGIVDDSKRTVVRTFVGNFSNGYRHFFVARFGEHQATTVTVSLYAEFDCPAGPPGSPGVPGQPGDHGPHGNPGLRGANGVQVSVLRENRNECFPCPQGPRGPPGPDGPIGMAGVHGVFGYRGMKG
ncbi:EGF-like domain protein, partial [Ostertagia ostertagi]